MTDVIEHFGSANAFAEPVREWGACRPNPVGRLIIALSRHSVLGRGSARRTLGKAFSRVHNGPVDCHLWGMRVRLYPENNHSDRMVLLRPNRFDEQELAFLRAQIRHPGAVFVDVGANSGFYSLHAARHAGAGSRIAAVEPVVEVLARLAVNVAFAREAGCIDPTISVSAGAVAVGDRNGEALLSMDRQEGHRSLLGGGGRPVPLRRLSEVLDDCGITRVDAMKIDVEGYEDHVLLPYLDGVERKRWPHLLILEHVHRLRWGRDCITVCHERGYRDALMTRNNMILKLESAS